MKVAPSTRALPVASSETWSWSGRIASFTGRTGCHHAEQRERHEQQRDRMHAEAGGRKVGGKYFGELQAPRDGHLDVFIGQFTAQRRQHEERKDEDRAGQRHQGRALFGGHAIGGVMSSAFFTTLSFSAEQNCDQNDGAKQERTAIP